VRVSSIPLLSTSAGKKQSGYKPCNVTNPSQDFVNRDNTRFRAEKSAEAEAETSWEQQNLPILGNNTPEFEEDDRLPTYDETVQQSSESALGGFEAEVTTVPESDTMDTSTDH